MTGETCDLPTGARFPKQDFLIVPGSDDEQTVRGKGRARYGVRGKDRARRVVQCLDGFSRREIPNPRRAIPRSGDDPFPVIRKTDGIHLGAVTGQRK